MKPEAQRIAIAQATGEWEVWGLSDGVVIIEPKGREWPKRYGGKLVGWDRALECDDLTGLPDYLNDLNATISLCDFLAERGWHCILGNGLDKTWECEFYKPATYKTHADNLGERDGKQIELHYGSADTLTGAIAEAFLRTLGLWKDE